MAVSVEEARRELARRELERRRNAKAAPAPIAARVDPAGESWSPNDPAPPAGPDTFNRPTGEMSFYEPGMMEQAGNFLRDKGVPLDRMGRDLQGVDDAVRTVASRWTLGQADRLAAALDGSPLESEEARSAAARDRLGPMGDVISFGADVALPVGMARQGLTLAGRFGSDAAKGIVGLLSRGGLMAGEGAAYGAAQAAGAGEDIGNGAAIGGGFGAGGQLVGDAAGSIVNLLKKAGASRSAPSLDELRAAKSSAYRRAEETGAVYRPEAFQNLVLDIAETARKGRMNDMRHPQAMAMLKQLGELGKDGGAPSLSDLDSLRQVIWRDVARHSDDAEAFFGKMFAGKIDDFIDNADATAMLSGNAADAASAIKDARSLNRRYRNAEGLETAEIDARRRAGSTYSGGNQENALRQELRKYVKKNPYLKSDEVAALDDAIMGTEGQNFLRWAGNKLTGIQGSTGSLGAGGGLGLLLSGGDPGSAVAGAAALPIISALTGGGAKSISRGIGNVNQRVADTLIRTGKSIEPAVTNPQIQNLVRLLIGAGTGGLAAQN